MTMTRRLRSQERSEQCLRQTYRAGTAGSVADVLVDTDVFIDHLRGAAQLRPGRNRLHYSVITRAELFAGNTATALVSRLLAPFREVAVDRDIAERAGRVARESGLRLPDALIAATALAKGLQLSTRNVSDFDKVRGLRIKPPR